MDPQGQVLINFSMAWMAAKGLPIQAWRPARTKTQSCNGQRPWQCTAHLVDVPTAHGARATRGVGVVPVLRAEAQERRVVAALDPRFLAAMDPRFLPPLSLRGPERSRIRPEIVDVQPRSARHLPSGSKKEGWQSNNLGTQSKKPIYEHTSGKYDQSCFS